MYGVHGVVCYFRVANDLYLMFTVYLYCCSRLGKYYGANLTGLKSRVNSLDSFFDRLGLRNSNTN